MAANRCPQVGTPAFDELQAKLGPKTELATCKILADSGVRVLQVATFIRSYIHHTAGVEPAPGWGIPLAALKGGRRQACGRRRSVVADWPLEADALLALEEALRVDLGLDRLELREAVRAPDVLLHRDALLLALGVREVAGAVSPRAELSETVV